MNTDFDYSPLINVTNVDIYIRPSMGREHADGFKLESVNLTWGVTSFENDILEIQLYFHSTLEVSPINIQDTIVFHIK